MKNFDYIKDQPSLRSLYHFCNVAEITQISDPEKSAINSRKALEWIVRAVYAVKGLEIGERTSLFELVDGEEFKEFVGNDKLMMAVHYIRKVGNAGAHMGKVSKKESFFALLNVYNFIGSVFVKLGLMDSYPPFNNDLIPQKPPIHIVPVDNPEPSPEFVESVDINKVDTTPIPTPTIDISESETRKLYIDLMLKEAGWNMLSEEGKIFPSSACVEVEVFGMPNEKGVGYADYVLFGPNGVPLAVVEAKRTSKSYNEGKHQAELYADCLEKQYQVRPVIYYTNGFETYIIDGLGYPPRRLYAFHTEKDLQLLIERRNRGKITDFKVKDNITDRDYQKSSIKAVCEHLNKMHRRALLVMATGTGKTRVAISLVDVLMKNEWVKNVLFLADRTSLVRQAHRNFVKLLPNTTTCVLSDNTNNDRDMNARIMFSTYQTMINYIDTDNKEFSVGRFDLIIIDEAHRSVFGKYGAIFNYFDSFLVGLTATPREDVDKSTYELLGLEDGNPTYDYSLQEAVNDGYLVSYSAFKKGSLILKEGIKYDNLSKEEKEQIEKIWEYERLTRAIKDDVRKGRDIESNEIFTYIFNTDTIDKVLQDLMQNGLTVQGGERIGKTIIFAYNHQHAELIVERFNVLYPEYGNDFCVLIDNYVNYAQDLIDKMEKRDCNPQIAVSVDMLDTGIDIPDVLNLVFFKIVKSKIKFWQMIGRGTRLSENIFGAGKNKETFYIFDWCRNFEYFGKNPNGKEAKPTQSLTERLFCIRTELAFELQHAEHQAIPFEKQLHDDLKDMLMKQVQQLSDNHISVREQWANVSRMKQPENWIYLSMVDVEMLKKNISPLLIKNTTDEGAKRFDLLVLIVELSMVSDTVKGTRSINNIITIAKALSEKSVIPQIQAKMDTIKMVLSEVFWENMTFDGLEKVRLDLRDLVKFVFGDPKITFEVDIEDTIYDEGEAKGLKPITSYRQRVLEYLAEHRDLPVLQKILKIEPLTESDIKELERILWDELGTKEEYQHCTQNSVAVFIRSIIGIDRVVAVKMFSQFISDNNLNSQQEEYLKTIINYVCENGDIDIDTLINYSPFNDFDLIDIWGSNTQFIGKYIERLHAVITA